MDNRLTTEIKQNTKASTATMVENTKFILLLQKHLIT